MQAEAGSVVLFISLCIIMLCIWIMIGRDQRRRRAEEVLESLQDGTDVDW